jgi:hypothetical protein
MPLAAEYKDVAATLDGLFVAINRTYIEQIAVSLTTRPKAIAQRCARDVEMGRRADDGPDGL